MVLTAALWRIDVVKPNGSIGASFTTRDPHAAAWWQEALGLNGISFMVVKL